jgi:hypothetical protein
MLPLPDPLEIKHYKSNFTKYDKISLKIENSNFKYKIYIGERLP